ncbi:MAG TPA: tetratricopeptide repeat protein [Methanothrix sp.]|nr:tetratricopeptide repeat protein [Methanothrix sp.]
MKILGAFLCIFLLSAICLAEETEYFDWKGNKLSGEKNYTGALIYFDKALRQEPGYIDAWIHKGDAQRALKEYNASIDSYRGALKIDSQKAAAWSGITEDYTALKDFTNASIAAAKTTELDNSKANWLREGNLMQTQEKYQEAVVKYEEALTVDPAYKDALYKKGVMLMALNNLTDAAKQFDQALQADPNFKQAYVAKGVILEADGKFLEAQKAYDKALEIDPAYAQALAYKMHVLLMLRKQEEAMKIFVKI